MVLLHQKTPTKTRIISYKKLTIAIQIQREKSENFFSNNYNTFVFHFSIVTNYNSYTFYVH